MKKLIVQIVISISVFAESGYIDFGSSNSSSMILNNSFINQFMSSNRDIYEISYSTSISNVSTHANTHGTTVSKPENRGNNFKFVPSIYLGWVDSFSGSNLTELDISYGAYYQFPISNLLVPYFGAVSGLAIRDYSTIPDNEDGLLNFMDHFIVMKLELGNSFVINDTFAIKLYYQKSYTQQKADILGLAFNFSVPK